MSARLITSVAVVLAGCLDAVSGSTCAVNPSVTDLANETVPNDVRIASLSRLDYLAIASMVDAQRPLAMAGYRPSTADFQAAN